jgi:hypothetical protein
MGLLLRAPGMKTSKARLTAHGPGGGGEARKDSKQQWQEHEIVDQAHGKQREI